MVVERCYSPACFVWAGFMAPGKHTIYVYDRINRIFYEKNILIDMTPQGQLGRVDKPGPNFKHKIEDLTPAELEMIDKKYPRH